MKKKLFVYELIGMFICLTLATIVVTYNQNHILLTLGLRLTLIFIINIVSLIVSKLFIDIIYKNFGNQKINHKDLIASMDNKNDIYVRYDFNGFPWEGKVIGQSNEMFCILPAEDMVRKGFVLTYTYTDEIDIKDRTIWIDKIRCTMSSKNDKS